MTLPLTKDVLRAAYNYLNETSPFCKWNLPDGEDVDFEVATGRDCYGWLTTNRRLRKRPRITISSESVGQTATLIAVMAHEMVHLHQYLTRQPLTHGPAFKARAKQVCRVHGFDPKTF
jgi:hypothetical protein